jgi:hypothetical protein
MGELSIYNPGWRPAPEPPFAGAGRSRAGQAQQGQPGAETNRSQAEPAPRASEPGPDPATRKQIRQLAARDREVRAHEAAHLSVGGRHALGGAQFRFQRGPDGRLYAVGGEVQFDRTPVRDDPQATLRKAKTLQRAALASAEPSTQDLQVAAAARAMAMEARTEIREGQEGQGDRGAVLAYRRWSDAPPDGGQSGARLDRHV